MTARFKNVRSEAWTNEEYHSRPWDSLSASRLKVLRDNPQSYYQQFLTGEMEKPDTAALRTGRLFHEVLLEQPVQFDRTNFRDRTLACWAECREPDRDPDISSATESIWFRDAPEPGVVRTSAIWGEVGNCFWRPANPDAMGQTCFVAFADMLLDGHAFWNIPEYVLSSSGSRSGNAWKAFAAQHADKELLKNSEWTKFAAMRREICQHRIARELLYEGEGGTEFSLVGEDAQYGVEVRTRIDRFRIHNGAVYVSDLKTAADSSPKFWTRAAINLKLYVQAFIMSRLAAEHFQMPVYYRYIVIDKARPYRCEVFEVEPELIEIGERQFDQDLKLFCFCRDSGNWRPASHGKLNTIYTPTWLQQDHQLSWVDDQQAEQDAESAVY